MSVDERKVLIIAYYFPPMGLSGVQRTAKFVKYLPHYGWKPTVLTVAPTGYFAVDETLLAEVESAGVRIVRASSLDANSLFKQKRVVRMPSERMRKLLQFAGDAIFFPDTKIGWKSRAVLAASDLLRKENFDLILATAPPQTDFLIGRTLKKMFRIPLVLDYRDAWLEYPFKYFPTPLHRYIHYRMEKGVVKDADRIIVTLRKVKEGLLKRYPGLGFHDVVIIPQGFDPEDIDDAGPLRASQRRRMRVTHAGTFYAGRNPATIFQALQNIFAAAPQLRGRIELVLIGNAREEDQRLAAKLGLQNDVTFLGYLEHRECIKQLVHSDVLWFVLDNDYQSPGKLYEYIGARKPILGSLNPGHLSDLILQSGAGVVVPPTDVGAHERALMELFGQFARNQLKQIPAGFANKFDRLYLTGQLAKEIESLMDIDKHAFRKKQEQVA